MALGAEIAAALRVGSVLGPPRADDRPEALVGGLVFLPAVGLAIGLAATAVARGLGSLGAVPAGAGGAFALAVLGGTWIRLSLWPALHALVFTSDSGKVLTRLRAAPGAAGTIVAAATTLATAAALASVSPDARAVALLVAPTLARWVIVVQCHGGRTAIAREPAASIVGRAGFREFGIASVMALVIALVVSDALGLAAAVAAVCLTLGIRLLAHRRLGGLSGRIVAATGGLVELGVVALLAAITRAAT